ncbi:dihydropyrimidinase [Sulfitobacter mediterraneus]|uniref:dihydropyrimidinase n=1 Tax=Sulfitobacter mediterraneus TaxID=83219 RepID=UPI001932B8A8|nr:dihydropyrimidinase [Sulfitobacter mediterraneus]MBM1311036.1 dihydropyrimidinase [Sulfitobacter mediterraneus]MBM1314919.1 dihydropyrimidinase [Sulfitobacter mediterraneus]MBM1323279.1 dihydropyrimidinase [Sulfitobacter mediterraneus]MBM1327191.1 dihydropyrimidinase [Sulfitobacter mediterraneus]MBM1398539.1 dihydropyrimidinase [Sulfitobacter mediterraneus]
MNSKTFDLIIRGGTVVTPQGMQHSDVGVTGGQITVVAPDLPDNQAEVIDAGGHLVLPGGVDTHCHIEQISGAGLMNADTFETATRSAAFGGTTTVVSFAAQHPGQKIKQVVAEYAALAQKGAMIDHAFHMIVADTANGNLTDDLPRLIAQNHRSIKIFTTYDKVRQDDKSILDILDLAARDGALVCFHAENDGLIRNMTDKLLAEGKTAPKYHAASHPREAEIEAIDRMCRFAKFTGARIMIFHVSTREGAEIVRKARADGVNVQAETCPHYLFMTVDILEQDNPARFMCSPPQRTTDDQDALWDAIADGTLSLVTSDHAPYRMDASGKFANGHDAPFNKIANGMPGLETRLPLMFNAMVTQGRGGPEAFARVTATAPAQAFGLLNKGAIAPGFDADIVIWNPELSYAYGANDLKDNVGYNPFEGTTVTGMPVTVLSRGQVIVRDRVLHSLPGHGAWQPMTWQGNRRDT